MNPLLQQIGISLPIIDYGKKQPGWRFAMESHTYACKMGDSRRAFDGEHTDASELHSGAIQCFGILRSMPAGLEGRCSRPERCRCWA